MRVGVVDGFSTGAALAATLVERGATCFHIASSPEMNGFFTASHRPELYMGQIVAADHRRLPDAVARWGLDAVVPGTESGVELADALAWALGLPGNRPSREHVRRNKDVMGAAVAAAGLRTPRGAVLGDPAAVAAWTAEAGLAAAVVKPLRSAGTDNVWFCNSPEAAATAAKQILAAQTVYGEPNARVLVQERITGREFYLNSVSLDGRHRHAEIWEYRKTVNPWGNPVYDHETPVSPDGPEWAALTAFCERALDALGVRHGASHTEVFLTDEGEPVFIETGARLGGGTVPAVVERHCGVSQTALAADALLDPEAFLRHDERRFCGRGTAVRNVALVNHRPGTAGPLTWLDRWRTLESWVDIRHGIVPGDPLPETRDLLSSPGFVYLASDDPRRLEADYRRIRDDERADAYLDTTESDRQR